jgi:PAS domain S-box-containing protein
VKISFIENPRIKLIIESFFLLSLLIAFFFLGLDRQNKLDQQVILQESENFSSTIEDFVQTGQIFINSYASSLDISENSELVVLQLRKALIPFPFFSQLNLVDSNGTVVAGFPQNSTGQKYQQLPINLSKISTNDNKIIAKKNESSLFLFIKALNQNNSVYLIGESDLRANPLNSGFTRLLSEMLQEGVRVIISDSSGNEFLHFDNSSTTSMDPNSIHKVEKEFVLLNWLISFSYPEAIDFQKLLISEIPLILLAMAYEGFLFYSYLRTTRNRLSAYESNSTFNKQKPNKNGQIEDFKDKLLGISSLDEMGNLILNFADLEGESSIRLVCFDNPFASSKEIRTTFASGSHSKDYFYLDDQISELLKSSPDLNIPDLHDFKDIHLFQEKPFPIAIYAFPIQSGKMRYGFIWYGFEEPHTLRNDEKRYLHELIEAGKKVIITLLKYNTYKNVSLTQNLILESIPHPVLLTDSQNNILYFNQAFGKNLGIEEEIIGKKIQDSKKFPFLQEVLDDKEKGVFQFTNSDGLTYKTNLVFIEDNAGQKNKIMIFENISDQEEQTKKLNEMTALISHDMRVPLATIKGYLSMLPIMGQVNQQQRNYIETGIHQIDELTDLIKNLMAKERFEKKGGIGQDHINVNSLIDEIVFSLKPLADQKKIEINNEYRENPDLIINADKWLIRIAIKNILENAIRFTPNNGKILIQKVRVQDNVEISIEDTGIGIAAVDLPHIFEKSYQVKIKSSPGETGSGQSLAMVKSIVEKQGGEIGAVSNLGKGSTFYIRLPINKE